MQNKIIKAKKLINALKLDISDLRLLQQSLSHRSYSKYNNERLEFLGDAILSMIIANHLYITLPNAKEGLLTRLRASLVSGKSLAKVARTLELQNYILVGPGELKSGGVNRTSILADAFEALVAAIFLDKGLDYTTKLVVSWFDMYIKEAIVKSEDTVKDAKTRLQEYLQASKYSLPNYKLLSEDINGEIFKSLCTVSCLNLKVVGTGASKKEAEQNAAEIILGKILNDIK